LQTCASRGQQIELETISGLPNRGNFDPPSSPHYQGYLGYENHTEQKIVEYLRETYKSNFNVKGTIEIVSERPFCNNCMDIVDQFQAEFKNITVIRVSVQP